MQQLQIKLKIRTTVPVYCEVKLDGDTKLSHSHGEFNGTMFRHYYNFEMKALELGATVEGVNRYLMMRW